ncbi:MAG: molybdenum cofactor guanylyltransferase [Deltaproteobacteria bacterium]|nr:molybdenum cofactor guanylyltransferase [Deltaproteobacteria bacterium]
MTLLPCAAILAGGRGRRMGADKVLVTLEGTSLIERVWARLAPLAARVIVVGGEPRLEHRGVETIADRYPGADSLGGVATALAWVSEAIGADGLVFCTACDMPFLEPSLVAHLAERAAHADVVVPRTSAGYEPLCAVYRAACLPAFEAAIRSGNLRFRDAYRGLRCREVGEGELRRFDPDLHSFVNINRPADLEAAARLLRLAG